MSHLLRLFLMMLILPWGAYIGTAQAGTGSPITAQMTVQGEHVWVAPSDKAVAKAERPCRRAALPGSHCGPDVSLLGDLLLAPDSETSVGRQDLSTPWRASLGPPTSTGPPRLL